MGRRANDLDALYNVCVIVKLILQALPQALAYTSASNLERPVFGMVTTGDDYIFIKLNQQNHQYAISDKFTAISNDENNNLYRVLQVMKRIISLFVVYRS